MIKTIQAGLVAKQKKDQEGDQVLPLLSSTGIYLPFFESSAVINISILDWQYSVSDEDEHY